MRVKAFEVANTDSPPPTCVLSLLTVAPTPSTDVCVQVFFFIPAMRVHLPPWVLCLTCCFDVHPPFFFQRRCPKNSVIHVLFLKTSDNYVSVRVCKRDRDRERQRAESSVCVCALCCECVPDSAADGYLSESSIDLAGVNNWLGLQAVMFGLIAEHWWSRAVIFLHIPLLILLKPP